MSEIREELEYFARLEDEKKDQEANENNNSNQQSIDEEEEFNIAPQNYDKELAKTFNELPFEWRRYLHIREQEVDKGFSKLRTQNEEYKWLDDIFHSRFEYMQKNGIKTPQEWLKNIIKIDEMLEKNPHDTITMLANSYGIYQNKNTSTAQRQSNNLTNIMSEQLIAKQINDFISEVDENGNLKHPYYNDVIQDIYDIISKGSAQNLYDAYEMAIWSNRSIRDKLIAQKTQQTLELKSKNAQKSKIAAFNLKGKALPETKDLTLREELEMRFAELNQQ